MSDQLCKEKRECLAKECYNRAYSAELSMSRFLLKLLDPKTKAAFTSAQKDFTNAMDIIAAQLDNTGRAWELLEQSSDRMVYINTILESIEDKLCKGKGIGKGNCKCSS